MLKEPGENNPGESEDDIENITPAEGLRRAEDILMHFNQIVMDVEDDRKIDLDNFSNTDLSELSSFPLTKREALTTNLELLEKYLHFLPLNYRDEAHKLIIRARIYIVADPFDQKQKRERQ